MTNSSLPPTGESIPPAGAPARSRLRDAGVEPISAMFRLLKTMRVHRIDNQAVLAAAESAAVTLHGFEDVAGRPAEFTFVRDMVFICGELMRAPRVTYEAARTLGEMLSSVGINHVEFMPRVSGRELLELGKAVTDAQADGSDQVAPVKLARIRWSWVAEPAYLPLGDGLNGSSSSRALELYAVGLAVMRDYVSALRAGDMLTPRRVKRLAQRLTLTAMSGESSFVDLTVFATAHRGAAGRALHTAILVLLMGRAVSQERRVLSRLAVAALTGVASEAWLRAEGSDEPESDGRGDRLGRAASVALAGASADPADWQRAVHAFELKWLESEAVFGPLYAERATALTGARLLRVARAYLSSVAPQEGGPGISPPEALAAGAASQSNESILWRLLARALGVLPTGTVVELDTGEWAVVAAPRAGRGYSRPPLRVLTDAQGNAHAKPAQVDLEQTGVSGIRRVVPASRARFNVVHTFFG